MESIKKQIVRQKRFTRFQKDKDCTNQNFIYGSLYLES